MAPLQKRFAFPGNPPVLVTADERRFVERVPFCRSIHDPPCPVRHLFKPLECEEAAGFNSSYY
jgi:hypothetical protein